MQNDNIVDLLQIRIENAKEKLPIETSNAIAAVDWKAVILGIRQKKGYTFEQLGDLELETELLLCGLTSSAEYPKELQTRMRISKAETDELVNEMNTLVFSKIKAELIKNTERKKMFQSKASPEPPVSPLSGGTDSPPLIRGGLEGLSNINKSDTTILKSAGIVVEPMRGEPETPRIGALHPVLTQKILGSIQVPIVKTEHTLENITDSKKEVVTPVVNKIPKTDPYREMPE